MSPGDWIIVPNWERFQHYKDRDPSWIKVYTSLLHNDDWLALTDAQKGLLLTIWLEFASAHRSLRVSRLPTLSRPVNVARTLKSLSDAGFIELSASKPLALTRSREKEKRREEKKDRAHAKRPTAEPRSNAAAYQPFTDNGSDDYIPLEQIEQYLTELKQ